MEICVSLRLLTKFADPHRCFYLRDICQISTIFVYYFLENLKFLTHIGTDFYYCRSDKIVRYHFPLVSYHQKVFTLLGTPYLYEINNTKAEEEIPSRL